MLPHALCPKSLRIAPHRNNQLIPPHLENLPLRPHDLQRLPRRRRFLPRERNALRRVFDRFLDCESSGIEVHAVGPALEELRTLLLAFAGAGGFERAAELEGSDGGGGQEGGEDEVRPGGDDDDLVFARVEVAGERVAGPA
jgi:hypothetical protein